MHAIIVNVTINDLEAATDALQNQVVPSVKQAPGFRAGYWTRLGDNGLSMVVFDSEEVANQGAEMARATASPGVTVNAVEVREVVAVA